MGFLTTYPVLNRLSDTFYCRSRRGCLTLDKCLEGFLQANAMERRRSACFCCPQGRRYREVYAGEAEIERETADIVLMDSSR